MTTWLNKLKENLNTAQLKLDTYTLSSDNNVVVFEDDVEIGRGQKITFDYNGGELLVIPLGKVTKMQLERGSEESEWKLAWEDLPSGQKSARFISGNGTFTYAGSESFDDYTAIVDLYSDGEVYVNDILATNGNNKIESHGSVKIKIQGDDVIVANPKIKDYYAKPLELQSMSTGTIFNPISKIRAFYEDDKAFESGNNDGSTLEVDSKIATQQSTNYIRSVLNGYQYIPVNASGVYIDPAVELGDTVTYGNQEALVANAKYTFDGSVIADIVTPLGSEENYDEPYNKLVQQQFNKKVSLGDNYNGTTISRDKGIEMVYSPDGTEDSAIGKFYADAARGMAFQYRQTPSQNWQDWLYFDPVEKVFKIQMYEDAIDNIELNETFFMYSPNENGVPMYNTPDESTRYIGLASAKEKPNNPSAYQWVLTKGMEGDIGVGVLDTLVQYQIGDSGTIRPTGTWLNEVPQGTKGKFLWNRTTFIFTDNSQTATYSVSYYAEDGKPGKDGTSVTILGEFESENELPESGNTNGDGYIIDGDLWVWISDHWSNVGRIKGDDGLDGRSITDTEMQYYVSTSKETLVGGEWINTAPEWEEGKYLWTRLKISYKNPVGEEYTTPSIDGLWENVEKLHKKQVQFEVTLDGIKQSVEYANFDSVVVNGSGEFGTHENWTSYITNEVTIPYTGMNAQPYMTPYSTFIIVPNKNSMAGSDLRFFKKGQTQNGPYRVFNDFEYGLKIRRTVGSQEFHIELYEYKENNSINRTQLFTFTGDKPYEEISGIEFHEQTDYVGIMVITPNASTSNTLQLTELTLGIGNPKQYRQTALEVLQYAKGQFDLQSNKIELNIDEIKQVGELSVENKNNITMLGNQTVLKVKQNGSVALVDIKADAETGSEIKFKADQLQIDATTEFASGYDPSTKATPQQVTDAFEDALEYTDEAETSAKNHANTQANTARDTARNDLASKLGYTNYTNMINAVAGGKTLISGGFINTELLKANAILATHINVTNLSAISSSLGAITAGSLNIGSGKFVVSSSGTLSATGANISGTITAAAGTIGGWNITSSYFDIKPNSSNNNNRMYFDSAGTYRIRAYNASGTSVFWVNNVGKLYATNAEIKGKIEATSGSFPASLVTGKLTSGQINANNITATGVTLTGTITANSGRIGGWLIRSEYLDYQPTSGSNNSRFLIHAGAGSSYRIRAYDASGTARFVVSSAGALTATNATITGTITASAGTIGGFRIGSGTLATTEGSVKTIIKTGGDVAIGAGVPSGNADNNTSGAKFQVYHNGRVNASDLRVTGGTIGGFDISSSYLMYRSGTDAYGFYLQPQATTSSYKIRANNSSGTRVFSVSGAGQLYATGATISGAITATSGKIGNYTISSGSLVGNNVTLRSSSITIAGVTMQSDPSYGNGRIVFSHQIKVTGIIQSTSTIYGNALEITSRKNAIVPTRDGVRGVHAYETAVAHFGDIYETFVNEVLYVEIEPLFSDTIELNDYHVFVSAYSNGNVWVENRTPQGFEIHTSVPMNVSYEIKGIRKAFRNDRLPLSEMTIEEYARRVDGYEPS